MVKDREAWRAIVYGVIKSQTQLNDQTKTAVSKDGPQRTKPPNTHAPV